MKLAARHKVFLAAAAACLALGFINYLLFSPQILFFSFLHIHPAHHFIIHNVLLRHIVTGYASDTLWVCALCLVTLVFTELKQLRFTERIIILMLPVLLEFAQYFRLVAGTFDIADIAVYLTIITAFIYFFPGLISLQNYNDEKQYN